MLQGNGDANAQYALDGMRHVMSLRGKVLLPYLIPKLTSSSRHTFALSQLAAVAGGDALNKHLSRILDALLLFIAEEGIDADEQVRECVRCTSTNVCRSATVFTFCWL
jgi:hypothetical protein